MGVLLLSYIDVLLWVCTGWHLFIYLSIQVIFTSYLLSYVVGRNRIISGVSPGQGHKIYIFAGLVGVGAKDYRVELSKNLPHRTLVVRGFLFWFLRMLIYFHPCLQESTPVWATGQLVTPYNLFIKNFMTPPIFLPKNMTPSIFGTPLPKKMSALTPVHWLFKKKKKVEIGNTPNLFILSKITRAFLRLIKRRVQVYGLGFKIASSMGVLLPGKIRSRRKTWTTIKKTKQNCFLRLHRLWI